MTRNFHDDEDPENPRVEQAGEEVFEYNPPYIKDDKSPGDIPYLYKAINLNLTTQGSYEITVTKRSITKDTPPDPEIEQHVVFYENQM